LSCVPPRGGRHGIQGVDAKSIVVFRFRRVSPIASGRSDGPLSDHRAGGQPAQWELVFMPQSRPCQLHGSWVGYQTFAAAN
jgi:hypothetical protein